MPINNSSPTIGNSAFSGKGSSLPTSTPGNLFPARVIDISLSENTNEKSLFQISKKWAGIGAIRFELTGKGSQPEEFPQGNIAYPLDNNFKKLPLIGEIVFILAGPSVRQLTEGNQDAFDFYYLNATNIWGRSHLNLFPSLNADYSSDTNTLKNSEVESGLENNQDNKIKEPKPGRTFVEKNNIRNLWPVEGDTILEGRWGNSLRFSSTAKAPSDSIYKNPWSDAGNDGDPITILRNGQSQVDLPINNWYPIYEDVSTDDSSIYMTSKQRIEFELASTNFATFGVDALSGTNTTQLLQDVPLENPNKSNKEADSTGSISDSVEKQPKQSTPEETTTLQGNILPGSTLPIAGGSTLADINTSGLKKITPKTKVEALILKKFDGTYRVYVSGEGLTSLSGESLDPEQLYADLIAETVSANPNKELDILAFKDVPIQG